MGATGTSEQPQLQGKFMLPVIDEEAKKSDPWTRMYHQPPPFKTLVPRSFPLIDLRPQLEDPTYLPVDMLQYYGFAVVKHKSAALLGISPQKAGEAAVTVGLSLYYAEMGALVKETTGASRVFITHSITRGGEAPEKYEIPKGLDAKLFKNVKECGPNKDTISSSEPGNAKEDTQRTTNLNEGPIHVPTGQPIRVPHQDYTPLGARQSVRHQRDDIFRAGLETGVITAEDKICENHTFSAKDGKSDLVLAEEYNQEGKLGPRYAAYSIWRPLKKIGRDPLALCPRTKKTANVNDGQYFYFHYDNKVPGPPHLGGDFLKEYAVLGLQSVGDSGDAAQVSTLKWYYVSAQEPDEVLFIKLFDSAALGEDARHAGAPWHASPDVGDANSSDPRESIELRVVAFW
ncbi:hypothetical protein PISL3812_03472 [Talaromyces islandicus]|uniref:Uncharacterized protein n=1 Tax=Talaromyces islandicus TaxID=28573 RepID=A0A0U1LUJ0_TALIS|nr:hypothetical protein PISL3812_03472 [Talaromyces islandicus]